MTSINTIEPWVSVFSTSPLQRRIRRTALPQETRSTTLLPAHPPRCHQYWQNCINPETRSSWRSPGANKPVSAAFNNRNIWALCLRNRKEFTTKTPRRLAETGTAARGSMGGSVIGYEGAGVLLPQEAKYVEGWPNTTSAWAGWSRFDIPVDRYGGVHSLLLWPSRTLGSST